MGLVRRVDIKMVIAVISVMIALFFGLYQILSEDKPNISLIVLDSTNVLDVHEPVKDLSISFRGEDIQKEELNLRIITLKMVNDGEIDILQSHYDMNDTWGIEVTDGEIIEVRLVESNSEYVKSNLNPRLVKDEGLIELEKIIFERGKYFVLEILVLHGKQAIPTILPFGKIAGIEEIKVSELASESEEVNFFREAFSGGAGVQFARTISYFFVFIGLVGLALLISFGLSGINKSRIKNSRRNEFRKFSKGIGDPVRSRYPKQLEVLSAIYEIAGNNALEKTKYFIEDISRITEMRVYKVEMHRKQARTVEELARQKGYDDFDEGYRPMARKELLMENDIIVQLIRNEIISEGKDKNVIVDNEFRELLDKSIEYFKG